MKSNLYVTYVPHGINKDVFKPLVKINSDIYNAVHTTKKYDFVLFYNNRNIRRKQPSDVILSYKLFCDQLPKEKSDKCLLLMHTSPIDENGTDLPTVKETLCNEYDVKFANVKIEQNVLNEFYNIVDCTINIANNEGFGLATAESLMSGTPIIVNVTGGLQDQCGFNIDGEEITENDYIEIGSLHKKNEWNMTPHGEWCVPVWSVANNLNGSPATPYLFDDRVNVNDVADAIMKVYNWGPEGRKKRGLVGRKWAIKNISSTAMCEKIIDGIETTLENWKPREKFNLYKIV
jgi:glycosyltransferase involved in cell wall biosynthesis